MNFFYYKVDLLQSNFLFFSIFVQDLEIRRIIETAKKNSILAQHYLLKMIDSFVGNDSDPGKVNEIILV
jgi:hypothetical protein